MNLDIEPSPHATYLPDELLLRILHFIPNNEEGQSTLASFVAVNRQWYHVGIAKLYEAPYLVGEAYSLFVRTLCPSVIPRIKRSELAGLVKALDLSRIVHQSTKSTTARLLGRTKASLEAFVAPQASFAINCWASLSKCSKLKKLDLHLVSEAISYQSLNQTLRQLGNLEQLYMPRCSTQYGVGPDIMSMRLHWPPKLQHLSMSGSVNGKFLWEMLRQPETFPSTLYSMSILHCPGLDHSGIKPLLTNLGETLKVVELRDLPAVKHGRFNNVLAWLPNLTHLSIALDYIDSDFGRRPTEWSAATHWHLAKPLTCLALVTSGQNDIDPNRAFTLVDIWDLIDARYLGRLRKLFVAASTGWDTREDGVEWETVKNILCDDLDRENWENRRWHYSVLQGRFEKMKYEEWRDNTSLGRKMRPRAQIMRNM